MNYVTPDFTGNIICEEFIKRYAMGIMQFFQNNVQFKAGSKLPYKSKGLETEPDRQTSFKFLR